MNDLDLLRTHGPAPTTPTSAVLDRALSALRTEIERHPERAATVMTFRPRTRLRRRAFGLGLAAATVAGAAVLAPSLLGVGGSGAIALGPVEPLSFPLTPSGIPSGLGDPVFDRDGNFWMAQYRGAGSDRVSVILPESLEHWTIPDSAKHVDVAGQDAVLFNAADGAVVVAWAEPDGDVVGVSGRGVFADPSRVEAFAESLTERPQQVDLVLTVAPEGWTPTAYKEDRIVQFTGDGDESMTVVLLDDLSPDLAGYGATDVSSVEVSGRAAAIGRKDGEGWVLEAQTSDGTPFSLQAPVNFSKEQVVEVANGVKHRS